MVGIPESKSWTCPLSSLLDSLAGPVRWRTSMSVTLYLTSWIKQFFKRSFFKPPAWNGKDWLPGLWSQTGETVKGLYMWYHTFTSCPRLILTFSSFWCLPGTRHPLFCRENFHSSVERGGDSYLVVWGRGGASVGLPAPRMLLLLSPSFPVLLVLLGLWL